MELEKFTATLANHEPEEGWSNALKALWYEGNGDWHRAHELVQDNSPASCHVHAYLHRKEGDTANARYWYDRAGQPEAGGEFDDEWKAIARRLLADR